MMRFGTLLKIQVLTLPAPLVSLPGFICRMECKNDEVMVICSEPQNWTL